MTKIVKKTPVSQGSFASVEDHFEKHRSSVRCNPMISENSLQKTIKTTKKSAFADLVRLIGLRKGRPDNLARTLTQIIKRVNGVWTRRGLNPVGLDYQAGLANLPSPHQLHLTINTGVKKYKKDRLALKRVSFNPGRRKISASESMLSPQKEKVKQKTIKKITIYIDESGTLPDKADQLVVVAAISTSNPIGLTKPKKSVKRTSGSKNISEIKFYRCGDKTRIKFLKTLAKQDLEIFIICVEKEGRSIADTPDNFALLCWLLLEDCQLFHRNTIKEVIFDRHFHQPKDRKIFDQALHQLLNRKGPTFIHENSQKVPQINTADMVAGSYLCLKKGKTDKFYKIIKDKTVSEKTITWRQLKTRFWNKKLNRTGAGAHPG